MKIKELSARVILDSRKEKTIEVSVKTENGLFSSSSPSGKSKGRNEAPSYIRTIEEDIKELLNMQNKLSSLEINYFRDLEKVEEIVKGFVGANVLYALETAILKALALEQGKQLWQVLNPKARRMPHPAGNCIGGGLHTQLLKGLRLDFQEFLIIPKTRKFSQDVFLMQKAHELTAKSLKARNALGSLNDENANSTNLTNEEALEILNNVRSELENEGEKVEIGLDVASSSFYARGKYEYKNPYKVISSLEQKDYIKEIIKKFGIFYAEDGLREEDFYGFSLLKKELNEEKPTLIVGDDLICSNLERLKKALMEKSVNAIIVKPNQVGSLIDIAKLVALAKKYEIATIMSHRSGETMDYALADYAFAFQTEFIKTGIKGKEREIKLNRLIEIEKSLQ